jgi:hypothetical protein
VITHPPAIISGWSAGFVELLLRCAGICLLKIRYLDVGSDLAGLRDRVYRDNLLAHCSRGARTQIAGHSKAAGNLALGGKAAAVVLQTVLPRDLDSKPRRLSGCSAVAGWSQSVRRN